MTIQHFEYSQLELPFWADNSRPYLYTNIIGHRHHPDETTPLANMVNGIHWSTTPEGHYYWCEVHNKLQRLESRGEAGFSMFARERGMGEALIMAFTFIHQPEGDKYWYDVTEQLRGLDYEIECREREKKRK